MKSLLLATLVTSGAGIADAQTGTPAIPAPTHDWGCEVLLCLANPNGPTAVAPCVPPIERLWRELARGRAFPNCAMASGPSGDSYARPAHRYYDPCPPGTDALSAGQVAELAQPMPPNDVPTSPSGTMTSFAPGVPGQTYMGIGTGDGFDPTGSEGSAPAKVCVAGIVGTRDVWQGDSSYTITLFNRLFAAPPAMSPRVIDVFIDDTLWHSVRW